MARREGWGGGGVSFEIVTEPGHGTGVDDWVVKADWHGARRVVFIGDPWECAHWAAEQKAAA